MNGPMEIRSKMTSAMVSALMTGTHEGDTSIGKKVTIKALRRRGLIAADNRWTSLGWEVALLVANTEPFWNPNHFPHPEAIHTKALEINELKLTGSGL